jgi:hypothetical protein
VSSYGSSESRSDDEEMSEDDSDSYSDDNDVDVRKSGKKNSPTNKNSFKQQPLRIYPPDTYVFSVVFLNKNFETNLENFFF